MPRFRSLFVTIFCVSVFVLLAACSENQPIATTGAPTIAPAQAVGTAPPAQAGYCKNGGAVVVQANEPLAARVNGQPIPLSLYQRQGAQAEAALVQQGVDPNSDQGKEALKGLRAQVLSQLIDDVLVEQEAKKQNISVSPNEINDRVQQIINDAGSKEKFDQYLTNNQLTIEDLCQQIRSNLFGEVMMASVAGNLPTKVEQVHVAHILFAKREDAEAALQKLNSGGTDFATLAKQVSQDEATRDNGGDLGWFPRDVMPPEFEQAAFALQPGKFSGVVTTQLGLHIIKLLERDPARALSPELIQNQRQAAFTTWLDQLRKKSKIETLVQE